MISLRFVAATLINGVLAFSASGTDLPAAQPSIASSPSADLNDRGSFAISFAGRRIGTEKFSIHFSSAGIEAQAQIQLRVDQGGPPVEVNTNSQLVLTPHFEPQTYTVNQKGSQAFNLDVDFRSSPARSRLRLATSKLDDDRDFTLLKDVVVLDDNVIHHYQLLVDRFAMTADKKQVFNAYIPQEALPGVLTVQEVGTEELEIDGHKEMLRHLVLSTELAQIDLWVDDQQHLQRVYNSVAQLEAVRMR